MQLPRFYDPKLPEEGVFELDAHEARHALPVLRCQPGDRVIVFDGCGREHLCRIHSTSKKSVELELVRSLDTNRELPYELTLVVALPKGDRQKTLVEMATQIGVTNLLPLEAERGVAQPTREALSRLQRVVIEASKQCGRNRLMQILPPMNVTTLATGDRFQNSVTWFAHPYDEAECLSPASPIAASASTAFAIAIGPEGGFTRDETRTLLSNNWQRISLGKSILRIETAAVTLSAWVVQHMLDR